MYSPTIPERLIPPLYRLARARRRPMTRLVAEILEAYLASQGLAPPVQRQADGVADGSGTGQPPSRTRPGGDDVRDPRGPRVPGGDAVPPDALVRHVAGQADGRQPDEGSRARGVGGQPARAASPPDRGTADDRATAGGVRRRNGGGDRRVCASFGGRVGGSAGGAAS
jgi:hypothetical protein